MSDARVLTPWVGDGLSSETAFRPKLLDDHPLPATATCADVTAQPALNIPPDVPLFLVAVTGVDAGWIAAVQADVAYLCITGVLTGIPPAAEFTAFCNFLVAHSKFTLAQVQSVVGATVAGRTRAAILATLVAWLRNRPHQ